MVGLIIVILGGIAVSSVTRVFVLQKMHSIAVLKCTGATQRPDHGGLSPPGDGARSRREPARRRAGTACHRAHSVLRGHRRATSLLGEVHYGITLSAAAQGIGIGVLVSLLFSVVPLLRVRSVKPSLLLRDERAASAGIDWTRMAALVLVTAGLVAVTAWQAASLKVGLDRLRRVRRARCRAHAGGPAAGSRRRAAGQHAVVSAAARRPAPVAPGQPDARHPARRRPRRLLHRRRARAAVEPARGVLDRDHRRRARHVPDGRPARAGGRGSGISLGPGAGAGAVPADSRAARSCHGRCRPRYAISRASRTCAREARSRGSTR